MRFELPKLFTANDAVPPPNQNRPPSLPGELRDMTYKYTLTEDQALLLVEHGEPGDNLRSFKGYRPTDPSVESNRLK
ncbi:uncharacterized protein ALTATR162_LOCUS11624 [Alternaria atra]|uniref:Uncharacterized protein n=1 Tax=Alternaria atra TaxID=119953 RepID=A0A8J2IPA4_9PLEO|nr:uncharacterized protein ALTATR162_LOCUS11624 [Alternaria atra]CAG5186587.1 unnamed protein product [Alternaria atra]